MLAGVTIDDACKVIGKRGATRTRDIVKALRHYGFACPDRPTRLHRMDALPSDAVIKYSWPGRSKGHWLLRVDGHTYDPEFGPPPEGGRVTSCILFYRCVEAGNRPGSGHHVTNPKPTGNH
jgi:hypothetical protein